MNKLSLDVEQYAKHDQFLSGVQHLPIQSFPSPRLVTVTSLKSSVCPNNCSKLEGERDGFILFTCILA